MKVQPQPTRRLPSRLFFAAITTLIAALLAACGAPAGGPVQPEARLGQVERGTIEVTVSATGDVAPAAQATLAFNVTGIVGKVLVEVGDRVSLGDPLMEVNPLSLGATAAQAQADLIDSQNALRDLLEPANGLAVAQAEQAVLDAAEAVKDAERHLSGVKVPDVADYQQTLDDALIALDNAQGNATLTELGGESGAVNAAQEAVNQAAEALGSVQSAEAGCGGCDPDRLQRAQDNYNGAVNALESTQLQLQMAEATHLQTMRDAQEAVGDARDRLAAAEAGPRLSEVALAEAQLATAQAEYEQRVADLADLRDGPDPDDVKAAQARVTTAEARLAEFRLVAPFAGTVVAVNFAPGDTVTPGAAAVVVADLSLLHIDTSVDELDIAQVEMGQPVNITLDALPNVALTGEVGVINLAPDPQQETIEYPVRVVLTPTDRPVRLGMTAALDILVARKEGVLLVPNWALQFDREQGATYVIVQRGGATVAAPVELGMRNESFSEVLSGLEAGDEVTLLITPEAPSGLFGGGG